MSGILASYDPRLTGLLSNPLRDVIDQRRAAMAPAPAPAPVPASAAAPAAPQRRGVNPLRIALATLLDGTNPFTAYDQERLRPQREAQQQARIAAQQGLDALLSGAGQAPALPGLPGMAPASGGVAAPMGGGLPSLSAAAPILARAQLYGVPGVDDLTNLLDKAGPDIAVENGVAYDRRRTQAGTRVGVNLANINGFAFDPNDPENANRYFPDLPEGAEPIYDGRGNVVGTRGVNGAIDFIAQRERATNDARNASQASYAGAISGAQEAAKAPYQIERVVGPNGESIAIPRSTLLQNGGIVGQAPAAAVVAEGTARNSVAAAEDARVRAAASNRILPQLDTMERLLGDINSGFGADIRTGVDRALAALPVGGMNDGAERRASATQTFQNEARQVVSGILPLFGANPTEGERKYAEKMSGADVNYTPESLREGIRLARERAQRDQQAYERVRSQVGGSAPAAPQAASGPVAVNARGDRIQWNGQAWVPIR